MKIAALTSLLLHAAIIWLAPAYREETLTNKKSPGVLYIGEFQGVFPPEHEKPDADSKPSYPHFIFPETETALIEPPAFSPEKVRETPLPDIGSIEETGFAGIPLRQTDILEDSLSRYGMETISFEERIEP